MVKMSSQYELISAIGMRLKSYRLGAGLTPEDVAVATGISRAAIYRYEAGKPIKVDALGKIADLLDVSLASLFGVESENISSAVTFFERLRQIEAEVDQITVMFGPIPYLLTTSAYDEILPEVLMESVPENATNREGLEGSVAHLVDILIERKRQFRVRKPNIIALISALELEHFLQSGLVGNTNSTGLQKPERHALARAEVENILGLLEEQPIGVQLGIVRDSMPGTSFLILRKGVNAQVAISPFRLDSPANVRIGVATITASEESVKLHQSVSVDIWKQSLKGTDAISAVRAVLSAQDKQ